MPHPERMLISPRGVIDARVRVPGSKSITNRALLVAALASGTSTLSDALVAEDSEVMIKALQSLGAHIERLDARGERLRIQGVGGRWPVAAVDLNLVLSGTSIRFLTAAVALGHGQYRLDGNARMRERPIGDLVNALRDLGVNAEADRGAYPPLLVHAQGLPGGQVRVEGSRSSQFLSGLLLAAPYAHGPLTLEVTGVLQSKPFIDMTLAVMAEFGVVVAREGYARFAVQPGNYQARDYAIEGDAMAAGYAWGAAVMAGGRVQVLNVGDHSTQGDRRLLDVLGRMGCRVAWEASRSQLEAPSGGRLHGGTFDLNDQPDQAQTLAVLALVADRPVEIVNVGNLRIKETDRLHALATELRKFGAQVDEAEDGLRIVPPAVAPGPVTVDTYGDHRMAMAFALAGARWPGVHVRDPACVDKTYPAFFDDLRSWGVGVEAA